MRFAARFWWALFVLCGVAPVWAGDVSASQPGDGKLPTLAVLPFVGGDAKEQKLAERMRFAVSQKIVNDADFGKGPNQFSRMDNVKVEEMISALQIPWAAGGSGGAGTLPDEEDLEKLLAALGTDKTIAGIVKGRKLTLILYEGARLTRTASVEIPSDKESPKLAVEQVLSELTGAKFVHMRDVEADHSDAAAEKRFAGRKNLVTDPGFEEGGKTWDTILGAEHYAPPVIGADEAAKLAEDRAAIVPKSVAVKGAQGHCLMMKMSKNTAENNGLACVSTWIAVEAGKKYRFSCEYLSHGPTARLFLKGFAVRADQYGDKSDPEAVRREYYRAQVAPRKSNKEFELIEMDFTPSSLKAGDPKIEWMRVDLYVYLTAGVIYFDDVVMKKLDE